MALRYDAIKDIEPCPECKDGCEACEYKGYIRKGSKKPKYGNKKTKVDGITFDSKLEADYYCHLRMLQQVGIVKEFTLQPKYTLVKPYVDHYTGKLIKPMEYTGDFLVTYKTGRKEVHDAKGHENKEFLLKKKLYGSLARENGWPQLICIVRDSKRGWANLDDVKRAERQAAKYARQAEKARSRSAEQSSARAGESVTRKNI